MTVTLQNLRAVGAGVEPGSLLPGQLAFNVTDKTVFVGNGSSTQTSFDGTVTGGTPGGGWYAMPMDFESLNTYFLANPELYGDFPTDGQVVTWSTPLNRPIWTSSGAGGSNQVYTTTNGAVALAPGATTSDKISAAIGVASPDEGNVAIVSGIPGEVYQGLYLFITSWVRAASYAYPLASQVPYDGTLSGLSAINVQQAIDEVDGLTNIAQTTANTAVTAAATAQTTANAALPKAGGTMTGAITFVAGQTFPVSGIQDASSTQKGVVRGGTNMTFTSPGVIDVRASSTSNPGIVQLTDSTTTSSSTLAASAAAANNLQTQINGLSIASNVILAGTLNCATGLVDSVTTQGTAQGFAVGSPLPAAATRADYYVIVSTSGSYNPPGGGGPYSATDGDWFLSNGTTWQYLGVGARPTYATTTVAGIIQLSDNPTTQAGTNSILAVTPSSLQSKLSDSISSNSSTFIASSLAAKTAYDRAVTAETNSIAKTTVAAKGTIITGTAANTPVGLPVGLNNQFLIANSATATGLEWAGSLPGIVTSVTGTSPITVNNINPQTPIVGITPATTAALGAVQVGTNIDVLAGVISVATATVAGKGVVQVGTNIDVTAGTISVATADTATKGVVQVGTNIDVTAGTISVPAATTGSQGAVQVGTNIDVSSGTISVKTGSTTDLGLVVVGSNIQVAAGTISVLNSSTTQAGVVQLEDSTASTSTTLALTANQGYSLQQQINALSVSNNITLAGTIDGSTGLMITVTTEGTAKGFTVGAAMPAPVAGNSEYFTIVTVPGTMTPPGGAPQAVNDGDWWLSNGTSWQYLPVGFTASYATTTTTGVVQLATDAQTQTGTNTTAVVVPSALQSKMSDSTSTTSSTTIASSTAVKSAYDLANTANTTANNALPKAGGTMTGDITMSGAGVGIVFNDASTVEAISDSVNLTSSVTAASSTALKAVAQAGLYLPSATATTIYVNGTNGSDATGLRGTNQAFKTITAALAAASDDDTIIIAPATYTENITVNKSINLFGTFNDQAIDAGPTIVGTTTLTLTSSQTHAASINNLFFKAATSSANTFVITDNSFTIGGNTVFSNCSFASATGYGTGVYCLSMTGTWTRTVYFRDCSFQANIEMAAGTIAGAGAYAVIDNYLGLGATNNYVRMTSGLLEIRNSSQALCPIFQTGGSLFLSEINGWAASSAALNAVFTTTGWAYKGTSTGLGNCIFQVTGGSNTVADGTTFGSVSIGANVIYTLENVSWDTTKVTNAGTPVTAVLPNPNVVTATQARFSYETLKTTSTVSATNQLAIVLDSNTGTMYSVTALDAGTY